MGRNRGNTEQSLLWVVFVPERETGEVRPSGRTQGGNTAGSVWGLLSSAQLWVLANLTQKYWPWLLPATSADPWQSMGAIAEQIIHLVIHPLD